MKKLLLLFVLSISMISCTSEELPAHTNLSDPSGKSKYFIEWQSNQVEPSMNIEIIHTDDKGEVSYKAVEGITDHNVDIILYPNDILSIFIHSKANASNPSCYIGISKYKAMDLSSNIYAIDKMDLIYEKEFNTNGAMYTSTVKNIKQ